MNTVEPHSMTSPNYKTEECAKFTIDDVSQVFSINEVMVIGREYTFSCWVRSDTASSMIVEDKAFSTTTEWAYVMHTFIADQVDLHFAFVNSGAYYIYHAQLELGNKATDWDVAPEDVDKTIDDISVIANTAKTAADTAQSLYDSITEPDGPIKALEAAVGDLEKIAGCITIENGNLHLTAQDVGDKAALRLTRTHLYFVDNDEDVAWMTAKKLHIKYARVEEELEIGGFVWTEHATKKTEDKKTILKSRTGLLWKGGS